MCIRDRPARVTPVELAAGSRLVTLGGTVDQVVEAAAEQDDTSWLRARLTEPRRAGLADELRARLGSRGERLVDVAVVDPFRVAGKAPTAGRRGRDPRELFGEFLQGRDIEDPRLLPLFDDLHAAVVEGAAVDGAAAGGAAR